MSGINIEVYRTTFANRVVYISNDPIQAYKDGYAAGLEAAREAVERVSTLFEPLGPALAAIDALREPPPPTAHYDTEKWLA